MADRDFPRNPGLNIIPYLLQDQDQLARFTMRPIDYDTFSTILNTFDVYDDEFRRQMGVQLQAPSYEFLRIFWDVLLRGIIGEELIMLDNPLFFYHVAQYFLLKQILYFADLIDQHWIGARILQREQTILSTLSAALNSIQRRRLHRMAGRGCVRNAYSEPSENFICFLSFFQECAARFMMRPADDQLYAMLTRRLRTGRISYVDFIGLMSAMLQNPNYTYGMSLDSYDWRKIPCFCIF